MYKHTRSSFSKDMHRTGRLQMALLLSSVTCDNIRKNGENGSRM